MTDWIIQNQKVYVHHSTVTALNLTIQKYFGRSEFYKTLLQKSFNSFLKEFFKIQAINNYWDRLWDIEQWMLNRETKR